MNNIEIYNKVFCDILQIDKSNLQEARLKSVPLWDSVGHMTLLAAIEDAFDILIEPEDMLSFTSYEEGKEILKKYDIEF